MLWDPLALAALNQPADRAAAPPFARVLAEMFGGDPRAAAIALPTRPLHLMYAEPARAFIERTAARCGPARRAQCASPDGASTAVEAAGARWSRERRRGGGAVVRASPICSTATPPRSPHRSTRARADGVVADRDGQSLVRSAGARRAVRRAARPRDAVGVRQAARVRRRARRICRWCRAAPTAIVEPAERSSSIALAHDELLEALPGVTVGARCCARRSSASRARRSRWRPDSRRGRRPTRPCRGLFLAGDWIDTGLPATIESAVGAATAAADRGDLADRHRQLSNQSRRLTNADQIHELDRRPLQGAGAQGAEPPVVRPAAGPQSARRARADLDVRVGARRDGRIEIELGRGARVGRGARAASAACSASRTSRTRAARRTISTALASAILDRPRRHGRPRRFASARGAPTSGCRSRRRRSSARSAGCIKEAKGWRVDLDDPALTIHVEMLPDHAFYFFGKEPGAGGLPTGTGGRVACLLSGGIDSPVAAYRMMRRGCSVLFIHFHSYPILSRASQEKVREIAALLTTISAAVAADAGAVRRAAAAGRCSPSRPSCASSSTGG